MEELHDIGIPTAEWRGWVFDLKSQKPCFADKCSPPYATLYQTQYFQPPGSRTIITIHGPIGFNRDGSVEEFTTIADGKEQIADIQGWYVLAPGKRLQLHDNGRVAAYWFIPADGVTFDSPYYQLRAANPRHADKAPILITLDDSGRIVSCERCNGYVWDNGEKIKIRPDIRSRVDDDWFQRITYPSMHFLFGRLYEAVLGEKHAFRALDKMVLFDAEPIEFDESGEVTAGTLASPTPFQVQGKDVFFKGRIVFFDKRIGSADLAEAAELKDHQGNLNTYAPETRLLFDDDGNVFKAITSSLPK